MTIDETIEQLESIIDSYEILLGNGVNSDILDVDDLEAIKVAIASLELWGKVRAEIDEQYDRVHPYNISCAEGLEMALDIIDKHLQEVEE